MTLNLRYVVKIVKSFQNEKFVQLIKEFKQPAATTMYICSCDLNFEEELNGFILYMHIYSAARKISTRPLGLPHGFLIEYTAQKGKKLCKCQSRLKGKEDMLNQTGLV